MYEVAGNKLLNPDLILQEVGLCAGHRVADLGCGRVGQFTFPAARIVGEYGVVYAADIQKSIVQAVQEAAQFRHLLNVFTIWADLEQYGTTKIPQGTIDIALLVTTLLHAQQKETMLKEAARILKPGGRLVVVEWRSNGLPFIEKTATPMTPEEVQHHAQQAGLSFARSFSAGPYHFGLLFQK